MSNPYDHKAVEAKWQDRWERQRAAEVDLRHGHGKYYMLMMFPYPSGDRLHVGHGRNYILGDALYGRRTLKDAARLGLERQFLHATRLGFNLPSSGEWREFDSPLPADLQGVLDKL